MPDEKTRLIKAITAELADKSCGELMLFKILAQAVLQGQSDSSASRTHRRAGKRTASKQDSG